MTNFSTHVVVDIGNSHIKSALFRDNQILSRFHTHSLEEVGAHYAGENHKWIISSVSKPDHEIIGTLSDQNLLILNRATPIPISLNYDTPETLGLDRIAAATGAHSLWPGENILIIDMGTCITYDLLDETGTFQGGAIAAGLNMRLRAMSEFTHRLPDIRGDWESMPSVQLGKSTRACMMTGTVQGIRHEIDGFIKSYESLSPPLKTVLTGGDAAHFCKPTHLEMVPDLVLIGLNEILRFQETTP